MMSWLAVGLVVGSCGAHRAGPGFDAGAEASVPDAPPLEAGAEHPRGVDPGIVPIHRLNNLEYDNTIRDLLGVEAHADATFIPSERAEFDNNAAAFTIRDERYEEYFRAAQSIAQQVFADPALRARVVACAPAGAQDTDCAARSVRAFGLRAWRRPLTDDEVARLLALHAGEVAAGKDFAGAMQTVLTAMLSTVSFLYRIELDPDPASTAPHALGPYDLASRLSYWLWSTTPDDRLLGLAASGELAKPDVLLAQFARLLDDPRSEAFVESFAGQWLGERWLVGHAIEPTAFPEWDEPLHVAMEKEMLLYFSEFLRTDRPFDELLDADVNFVNARLARHYGMDATGLGDAFVRVENTKDQRRGFLGLAGFLTATSYSYRADPRNRARWVRGELLCDPEILTAQDEQLHLKTQLDSNGSTAPQPSTLYEQVQAIGSMLACRDCHSTFDPIAIGLEGFDGIGRFTAKDASGRPILTDGTLADGRTFKDELDLAQLLAPDPRFLTCATKNALTYALGRSPTKADEPYLADLLDTWKANRLSFRSLLEQIVVNDTFRLRRGEGP
jgi:hypothetical protein